MLGKCILVAICALAAIPAFAEPISIDHSKAELYRPVNGDVIACTSENGLPLLHRILAAEARSGLNLGSERMMKSEGCMPLLSTDPIKVDFVETVRWKGAVIVPKIESGADKIARGRTSLGEAGDYYFFVEFQDLVPIRH